MRTTRPPYRIFEHTADLGVEVYGTNERELFRNAALALFDIMTDTRRVEEQETRELVVEGHDREELLVNFLREVLSLYSGEGWLLKECAITSMDDCRLRAMVTGEPFRHGWHTAEVEIKAVTYHRVEIRNIPQGWIGTVVCDV
jgi:SHS2 domain-containing protein